MCYSGKCPFEDHMGDCRSHLYKDLENPCPPSAEVGPKIIDEYYDRIDMFFKEKTFIDALYVPDKSNMRGDFK